jgi:hypothetical protein
VNVFSGGTYNSGSITFIPTQSAPTTTDSVLKKKNPVPDYVFCSFFNIFLIFFFLSGVLPVRTRRSRRNRRHTRDGRRGMGFQLLNAYVLFPGLFA